MRLTSVLRGAVVGLRERFDFGGRDVARWFPGHMAKGLKDMKTRLRVVDCLLEVHDARIPFSGRNPLLKEALSIRPHLLVLNKMDLADLTHKSRILEQLERQGLKHVLFTDCLKDENIKEILPLVTKLISNSERYQRAENVESCLMVIGVPNVGKSSVINSMRRLHLRKGTIRDHLVGEEIIADYLLYTLNHQQQFSYVERYGLTSPCDDVESVLKSIALYLGKTNRIRVRTGTGDVTVRAPNYNAAACDFIYSFRKGHLGKVMLDQA
ncbi:mitochondrial ribosome-associated GTPase 1 isoform X3 [Hemicordylus capensis]|uniref:mitochondrial ribosome-associated GTPase 1 isoform X3 n=1 Tax=Hemicordylus capensis TaxID=884348 RepID=UPI0023046039|nr:mitochondrial ribosome-associated GTPase 1 isoform X3 [Hemicordylus capensis]